MTERHPNVPRGPYVRGGSDVAGPTPSTPGEKSKKTHPLNDLSSGAPYYTLPPGQPPSLLHHPAEPTD